MKKQIISIITGFIMACSAVAAPLGQSESSWKAMVADSVVDNGASARTKRVISKLKDGEKVYVACLGGSITEGAGPADFHDGYVYQFQKKLAQKYAKDPSQVVLADAGLSGSPSPLGLLRYQQDVVNVLGHKPDVLVIEFSVNDWQEPTNGRAFEALIRRGLEDNPDCTVIALYATANYANQQDWMIPIASHYQIPQVSIRNVMDKRWASGEVNKDDYLSDYAHPKTDGHTFMADCLMNVFETAEKAAEKSAQIPDQPKLANPLNKFCMITGSDGKVIVEKGSFDSKDKFTQAIKKTGKGDFPMNWHHKFGSKTNDPLKVTVKCKAFMLIFKENSASPSTPYGLAQVVVDGKVVKTCDPTNKGWNNCNVNLIIDDKEAKEHTIEVKMGPGDSAKAFTVVAMGYCE